MAKPKTQQPSKPPQPSEPTIDARETKEYLGEVFQLSKAIAHLSKSLKELPTEAVQGLENFDVPSISPLQGFYNALIDAFLAMVEEDWQTKCKSGAQQ